MKSADLYRVAQQFEIFRPGKLIFTKLDETATPGTILSTAIRTGLPLSFVASGPGVPEDLAPAAASEILKNWLCAEESRIRSAA
jgi:flagellar biosynthesis protein FlhF